MGETDEGGDAGPVDPFADPTPVEIAEVRPGEQLNWRAIEDHVRAVLAEIDDAPTFDPHVPMRVQQFPHGSANLTYLIAFGDLELVLRRPPFGTLAPGAHDMAREFRVLSRLWRVFDKAPRAFVFCDDHTVAGADFFVMERRRGEVIRGVIPASMRRHHDVGRRVGLALADAMGELHTVDPSSCDLTELGRPDGFVERQVRGWRQRWDLVADERYDARMIAVHETLAATVPASQRVSIVHNDLKLDNVMVDPADPDRVVAVFDWDMTTLGDPLIDLGTLLSYWPDPADPAGVARASHEGMDRMGLPSRADLAEHYAARSGIDVSGIAWYEAFAQWKTATVVQQLHHRWVVGDSTDERMATVADRIPALLITAEELLA